VAEVGALRRPWQSKAGNEAAIFPDDPVRRDGIEPPTRGFSVLAGWAVSSRETLEAVSSVDRSWIDSDEALRIAIKLAVDAGQLERAGRLLDVLRATSPAASVVELATRQKV
jgi:hypothetical protein